MNLHPQLLGKLEAKLREAIDDVTRDNRAGGMIDVAITRILS